jgi:hypothetical protein
MRVLSESMLYKGYSCSEIYLAIARVGVLVQVLLENTAQIAHPHTFWYKSQSRVFF